MEIKRIGVLASGSERVLARPGATSFEQAIDFAVHAYLAFPSTHLCEPGLGQGVMGLKK